MQIPATRKKRVALFQKRMSKAMPEIRRQVAIYEQAQIAGTLKPLPASAKGLSTDYRTGNQ
jgi:hypothetical protein